MRNTLANLIKKAIKLLQKERIFPKFEVSEIKIEHSKEKDHGDYSTNVAMEIAKNTKKRPMEIAENLKSQISNLKSNFFEKIEVAEPGFINFFLSKEFLQTQIKEILKKGKEFGKLNIGKNKKVNVEFISANPTGPLTLGNGRGGFYGDTLANVLEKAGYKVKREYYINDVGTQIRKLGHSVIGDSQALYKGKYIEELRKRIKGKDPDEVGQKAAKIILKEMIKPSVKRMGIKFDKWFSEKSLYEKGEVDKILNWLKKKKLAYEKEGALWFKAAKFGDDKDRVLVRQNGQKTYFASDIAYLKNKFQRGFNFLIFLWGADHAGYVKRMEAAVEALGYKKEQVRFIIMQLVKLFEKGKEVRMSKRTGSFVTLDELIEEVGLDVARFFFLQRSPGSHLNFDLDLAKVRGEKNPVYYVQYAHARICSILKNLKSQNLKLKTATQNLNLLNHPSELELIKQLIKFPEVVEDIARDYQVQRLPQYTLDLARQFHDFYEKCRVISPDKNLTQSRLALILATKIVLKNTLDLMGISAPERM
ncbi:MAG: arginine--tRNA ligase [Candidatus Nealsonbacteria bacterium]|nr:MAG: arginine--tRNA ligase [Candidatus Nealsonbacteria bacterium]